jgi:hypothetical protein
MKAQSDKRKPKTEPGDKTAVAVDVRVPVVIDVRVRQQDWKERIIKK